MEQLKFSLEVFSGPLELLLHLISKNKVSIYDIPISLILEQYMEYIEDLKKMDLEVSSEFIEMAAHLMLIKSRMLLPKAETEEEDPRMSLAEALAE
ncbi:MAG: segregation/condensation protein A, partial [Clostridia bacterium]|nr:segregation/condensation protein A [Clostridia bacterium]